MQTLLAVLGPFISPTKSLLLFNPIFVFLPWSLIHSWRKVMHIALPVIVSSAFLAIFQALHLREQWAGTLFWGLRFMLPVLPMIVLLLSPWLEWLFSPSFGLAKLFSWSLILLSFVFQLAGAVVAWHIPFEVWHAAGLDPYTPQAVWRFNFLVIPTHLMSLLNPSQWDIAWFRTLPVQPLVVLIPVLVIVLMILGFRCLRRTANGRRNSERKSSSTLVPILCLILALCLPLYPSLWLLREDPDFGGGRSELLDVIAWAEERVQEGDLVVVDGYGTSLWYRMMNDWQAPIPWYSLPYEIPGSEGVGMDDGENPSQAALELFQNSDIAFNRLFYITSEDAPDYDMKREERWLEDHFTRFQAVQFEGQALAEGSLYSR